MIFVRSLLLYLLAAIFALLLVLASFARVGAQAIALAYEPVATVNLITQGEIIPGGTFTVAYGVNSLTPMVSLQGQIEFDPEKVELLTVMPAAVTWNVVTNQVTPGRFKFAAYGSIPVSGSIVLARYKAKMGSFASLGFSGAKVNDAELAPANTTIGIAWLRVSGAVKYWKQSLVPVTGTIWLSNTSQVVSTQIGSGGSFTGSVRLAEAYTATVESTLPSFNEAVTAYDAALALRHSVGVIQLSELEQVLANATKEGGVTALDAAQIARAAIELESSCSPTFATQKVVNVLGHTNLGSIEVGVMCDVSGNWLPEGSPVASKAPEAISEATYQDGKLRLVSDEDALALTIKSSVPISNFETTKSTVAISDDGKTVAIYSTEPFKEMEFGLQFPEGTYTVNLEVQVDEKGYEPFVIKIADAPRSTLFFPALGR